MKGKLIRTQKPIRFSFRDAEDAAETKSKDNSFQMEIQVLSL